VNVALAVVAALVVVAALRALVVALPPRRRGAAVRGGSVDEGAGDLARLDRIVSTATTGAGDLHLRLRPILREIAADGLRHGGVDLDAEPEAAQALLAPETWELVRPDRPRPSDAFAPGLRPAQLDAVLDDLEGLLRPPSTLPAGTEPPGGGTPWA
jgi:hypothetical protein